MNSIYIHLRLLGIRVKLLFGMRGFIYYSIIIDLKWTMYMHVALVLKKITTYILYNPLLFVRG